jgi:SWI/SNF-related matrix-associated actin-dependent regulator of chromatin subfamily A-like protein 1
MTKQTLGQVLEQIGVGGSRFAHIELPYPLMPHQVTGLHYSLYYKRMGLFFEARTGKSIVLQANAIYHAYQGKPTVIVMPGSLFLQFHNDFNGLKNHGLTIKVFNQPPKLRTAQIAKWDKGEAVPHVVLMTREIFKKHWREFYLLGYRNFLYDEAHQGLQSYSSQTAKAFRDYAHQHPDNRLVLSTGTPIPSAIQNVWTAMDLLNPGAYRSHRAFEASHCLYKPMMIPSKFGMRQIQVVSGYQNLDLLNKNLYKQAVYASKREVLNIAEPNIQIISCKLSTTHKKLYDKVLKERILEIEREGGETELLDMRGAQKLRQSALQLISTPEEFGLVKENAVFDLVETLLGTLDIERNKVVLFANLIKTNEALARRFKEYKPVLIYGPNGTELNAKNVERFRNDPLCRLFIGSPAAGGVGFKLGDVCQSMIFVEPVSSPGIFDQAISRVCLMGQTEPVLVYIVKVEKTISPAAIDLMMGRIPDIERVMGTRKSLFSVLFKGEVIDVDTRPSSEESSKLAA